MKCDGTSNYFTEFLLKPFLERTDFKKVAFTHEGPKTKVKYGTELNNSVEKD